MKKFDFWDCFSYVAKFTIAVWLLLIYIKYS